MNEILPPYNLEFSYGEVPQLKHQNLELDNKMVLLDSLLDMSDSSFEALGSWDGLCMTGVTRTEEI